MPQYASEYYDPQKAHEYYMEHRVLKGRKKATTTVDLNRQGKLASEVIKKNVSDEKKMVVDAYTAEINSQISALQDQIKSLKVTTKTKVAVEDNSSSSKKRGRKKTSKNVKYKTVSSSNKAQIDAQKEQIRSRINELKEQSKLIRKYIESAYDDKYVEELQKLKQDSSMKETFSRGSLKGLNEEGREAARQVKERINEERNSLIESHKTKMTSKIDSLRSDLQRHRDSTSEEIASEREQLANRRAQRKSNLDSYKEQTSGKIDALRNRLKGMTKAQKKQNEDKIREEIAKLQGDNKEASANYQKETAQDRESTSSFIAKLRNNQKSYSTQVQSDIKSLRDDNAATRKKITSDYKEKYYDEIDKIRNDEDLRDY